MIKAFFFLFIGTALLQACADKGNNKAISSVDTTATPLTKRVFDLEPTLPATDSLQVIFYDDPDGDSLRYTRYFTLTETTDTAQVKALLRELNQVYVQEPNARPCRSEGKLYLLQGEDVLKTIYFSDREDSCRYFYFIKDGVFVYLPLTSAAADWLQQRREGAKKP